VILLFGTRMSVAVLATVWFVCHFCGEHAAQRVIERRNRLTLFWIPLFTVSRSYANVCTNCGREVDLTIQQVANAERWAATQRTS
jgi:predicted RNA-binding Zn-ribbon protein involved in translation (DUF1610 family)